MQEGPNANEQAARVQSIDMEKAKESEKSKRMLQEKAELFQSLLDNILDGILICNWDGKILFANKSAARMVGLKSPEEGLGRDSLVFVHPDSKKSICQDLALVKEGKGGILKEYRLNTVDGESIWVEAIGNKVNYNGGTADLVTFRDVTKRKQAEAAAQEAAKKYQTIFESTGTTMVIIEEDMTISLANEEAGKITGYSREEIEGKKKATELIAKDDLERMIEYHRLRMIDPKTSPQLRSSPHE